jgi:hypothetical protein
MIWLDALDDRQQREAEFARVYASAYHHGTDGHSRLMLIARLAALLDTTEADLRTTQGQCKIFQELVLAATEQLGDVSTPLPVSIARLRSEILAARRVVEAARAFLKRETTLLPIEKADSDALGAIVRALDTYDATMKDISP